MSNNEPYKPLSEVKRREIFLTLVETQDRLMTVDESRKAVAQRFRVSEEQVRQIELEGLDCDWPPLG